MRIASLFAIGALSLSLSAAVLAHDQEKGHAFFAAGHSPEEMHEFLQSPEGQAYMQKRLEERLGKVREALKLSGAQESAWQEFTATLKADIGQLRQLHRDARPAGEQAVSLPERLQKHLDMKRAALPILEHALAALKTFYAGLNPEQQAIADRQLRLRVLMGHGFTHGGGHGGRGQPR